MGPNRPGFNWDIGRLAVLVLVVSVQEREGRRRGEMEAWVWVVEALADLKQVDSAVVDDLLSEAPRGYDSLSTNTRERLALRRLDDLLSKTTNAASDDTIIDVTEPAQDVYRRLLHMMEVSSSGASELSSLESDISQFVLQKRARLPKCILQQLEQVLMEGRHLAPAILRGVSGLNKEYQDDLVRKLGQISNIIHSQTPKANSTDLVAEKLNILLEAYPYAKPSSSTRKKENKVQFVDGVSVIDFNDNITNSSKRSAEVGEFHPMNEIASPLVPDDRPHNAVNVTGKRKVTEFTEEEQETRLNHGEHLVDHNSDLMRVCESFKSPNASISSFIQNKATELGNRTQVQDQQESRIFVDDGLGDHVVSKRIKKCVTDGQTEHCQQGFVYNSDNICEEAREDSSHEKNYVDHAKSGSQNQNKPETSIVNSENPNKFPFFHSNGEIAIAPVTSNPVFSQLILSQNSPESDWAEDNSCIKCKRGGQLLTCCVSTCPITVHENCLGSPANFNSTGNFYCPVCSCSQTITSYHEIKKEFLRAKEKAEVAKNRLYKFLKMENEGKQKQPFELPSIGELVQSRTVETGKSVDEVHANGKQKVMANNEAIFAGVHLKEVEVANICSNTLHQGPCIYPISERDDTPVTRGTQQRRVNDHVDGEVLENQECVDPSFVQGSDNLSQRDTTTITCVKTSNVSDLLQHPVNAPREHSPLLRTISNLPCVVTETAFSGQEPADVRTEDAESNQKPTNTPDMPSPILKIISNSPCLETVSTSQENADVGNSALPCQLENTPKGFCPPLNAFVDSTSVCTRTNQVHADTETKNADEQRSVVDSTQRPLRSLDINVEEVSENYNTDGFYEFRRRRQPVRQNSNHTYSPRRKKTPWTSDEEEKLKEGVQIFANEGAKSIPWKQILEFGRNVFLASRTTIDLKDKWRNICIKG